MKKRMIIVMLSFCIQDVRASVLDWFKKKFSDSSKKVSNPTSDDTHGGILILPTNQVRRESLESNETTASRSLNTSVTSKTNSDVSSANTGSSYRSAKSTLRKVNGEVSNLNQEQSDFKKKDLFEKKFFDQVARGDNYDQIEIVMRSPGFDMRRALEHAIVSNNEKALRYIISSSVFKDFNKNNIVSVGALLEQAVATLPNYVYQYCIESINISDKAFVQCLLKAINLNKIALISFLFKQNQFQKLTISLDDVFTDLLKLCFSEKGSGHYNIIRTLLDQKSNVISTKCLLETLQILMVKKDIDLCKKMIEILHAREIPNDSIKDLVTIALQQGNEVVSLLEVFALQKYVFTIIDEFHAFDYIFKQNLVGDILKENIQQNQEPVVWIILQGLKRKRNNLSLHIKNDLEKSLLLAVQNNNLKIASMLLKTGIYGNLVSFLEEALIVVKTKGFKPLEEEFNLYIKAYKSLNSDVKDDLYKDAFDSFCQGNPSFLYSLLFINPDQRKIQQSFKPEYLPSLYQVLKKGAK